MDMRSFGRHSLLLIMAAGLSAFTSASIPAGTDTAWTGNLTQGGKFGVAVGQSASDAQQALWTAGYGYEGMVACSPATQMLFGCASDERYLEFQPLDLSRKGHVFLKVKDNQISQIGWEISAVAFLDG